MQAPVARYPVDNTTVGPAPRVRTIINKTDDFEQAGVRYRSFDAARQARILPVPSSCVWALWQIPGELQPCLRSATSTPLRNWQHTGCAADLEPSPR